MGVPAGHEHRLETVAKPGALLLEECRLQQVQLGPHCLQWMLPCRPASVESSSGTNVSQQKTNTNAMETDRRIFEQPVYSKNNSAQMAG